MDSTRIIRIKDLAKTLRKHFKLIAGVMIWTIASSMIIFGMIPKTFKSGFVISIYSKYFQNPMVRDFTPETYDSTEMRPQRESLVKKAFDDAFLDQIGEKYSFFSETQQSLRRGQERMELLQRFELVPLNSTTFQVSFLSPKADTSFHVAQDTVDHVVKALIAERKKMLIGIRDAVSTQINSLIGKMQNPSSLQESIVPTIASKQAAQMKQNTETIAPKEFTRPIPPALAREIQKSKIRLNQLSRRFTNHHPEVLAAKRKLEKLEEMADDVRNNPNPVSEIPADIRREKNELSDELALLNGMTGFMRDQERKDEKEAAAAAAALVKPSETQHADSAVYDELVKKLNYLNVAVDLESEDRAHYIGIVQTPEFPTAAIWPKGSMFLGWGILAGMTISLFAVLLIEFFTPRAHSAEEVAEILGVPLLGVLPNLRNYEEQLKNNNSQMPPAQKLNLLRWRAFKKMDSEPPRVWQ